ncbi:MAG: fumarate hydratase C-terminal domain-containing protein, partial [Kiritimatiellae bacterium]|nr:fumarate hydratase C-terminal domain-containing protein [Kiritimatiellia bacterium]
MKDSIKLEYPFTKEQVSELKVGMRVSLSGCFFSARDRFHKYLFEGGESPVSLKDGAVYHCGPVVVERDGKWVIRAAGPTTSMREEPYMASIIKKHGVRVIIGKGGMGATTKKACKEFGCVYMQAVGGAASVLASRIVSVDNVHLMKEFGSAEAVWEFTVSDFEAIVTIDSAGRSLNERIKRSS